MHERDWACNTSEIRKKRHIGRSKLLKHRQGNLIFPKLLFEKQNIILLWFYAPDKKVQPFRDRATANFMQKITEHKVNVRMCIWPVRGLCYWLCTVVRTPTSFHKVAREMSIDE